LAESGKTKKIQQRQWRSHSMNFAIFNHFTSMSITNTG
jgi:hypothetical protein